MNCPVKQHFHHPCFLGTYVPEKREKLEDKVVYGLVHPLESNNPFYAQVSENQIVSHQATW